jgi:hypothetical protein
MPKQLGIKQELIEQIQTVFSRFSGIERAILYGSRAKGKTLKGDDIFDEQQQTRHSMDTTVSKLSQSLPNDN